MRTTMRRMRPPKLEQPIKQVSSPRMASPVSRPEASLTTRPSLEGDLHLGDKER
jgi:hypothetical protein